MRRIFPEDREICTTMLLVHPSEIFGVFGGILLSRKGKSNGPRLD
jgi:hypothetical protein